MLLYDLTNDGQAVDVDDNRPTCRVKRLNAITDGGTWLMLIRSV